MAWQMKYGDLEDTRGVVSACDRGQLALALYEELVDVRGALVSLQRLHRNSPQLIQLTDDLGVRLLGAPLLAQFRAVLSAQRNGLAIALESLRLVHGARFLVLMLGGHFFEGVLFVITLGWCGVLCALLLLRI